MLYSNTGLSTSCVKGNILIKVKDIFFFRIKCTDESCTVRVDFKVTVTAEKEKYISTASISMFSLNAACRTVTECPRKGSYARYVLL